ncbi:MAG: Crp/Fnr family transcriptional regulator [Rhodocyclaceae bacterium]|nr:Crp/Fnr family transcriptional regulator [Rhodocyclaceae bacterium]
MSQDANPENIQKILSHLPLFQALSPQQLAQIALGVRELRLSKGDVLFRRGDPTLGLHVVVFGQVKLAISSAQGNEKVVEIIGPRQSFGEAVMFLERPYPVTAEALVDTLLLHVARENVNDLLTADPSFSRAMLAGLSFRLHSLIQDVESYSMRSSTQRVVGYLLQLCPEDPEAKVELVLPTSKLVIASRLNLTPETLSRVLHDLSRNQLIEVDGRTIRIPSVRRLREFDV